MLKRFFLLVVLFSFFTINIAHAEVTFNNSHPVPGETISFNGGLWIPSNGYYRILIKEPSGKYILHPDYLSIHIKYNGHSNWAYKGYDINGTIKIGKDFVPGKYSLVFDFTYELSDYIRSYNFVVGNYSLVWKYKTWYPGTNWNKENFDDSSWRKGYMPFANPSLFPRHTNTTWTSNTIYLRKEVYLDNFTQANLTMFAENRVECWVNGHYVGSHNSIHALNTGNCYRNVWVSFGRIFAQATSADYRYNGIKFVDISKYLRPGKNVIACKAEGFNNVYRSGRLYYWHYYSGRQFVDVNFLPLQKNETFWAKYSINNYWNNPSYLQNSKYWGYTCTEVGCQHTTYKYVKVKNWYGPWQWNNLDITDDNTFYAKPEHFNWNNNYNDKRAYWGISPFNGRTTYFRKWIWSGRDKY